MPRKSQSRDGADDMLNLLKNKLPTRCILLFGEEVFLIEHFVKEIRNTILTPSTRLFNEFLFEGRIKLEALASVCETYPVMSERKLVLVRKSGLFKAEAKKKSKGDQLEGSDATGEQGPYGESDSQPDLYTPESGRDSRAKPSKIEARGDSTQKESWTDFFEKLPQYVLLVFVEDSVNRALLTTKCLEKYGIVADIGAQTPDKLIKWIIKGFSNFGKKITLNNAELLLNQAEDGMTAIRTEIEKIALYMGDRTEVVRGDIAAVVTPSIRSRIFDLMDAVAAGDKSKALLMLDEMFKKREPERKIFFMISKQAGRLMLLRQMGHGVSIDEKAERVGMHTFALSKLDKLAAKLPLQTLADFVAKCAELDIAIKAGKVRAKLALELLLAGVGIDG